MNENNSSAHLELLADLLLIEEHARSISEKPKLANLLVNDTRRLFNFRTAYFARQASHRWEVQSVSDVFEISNSSPMIVWLQQVFEELARTPRTISSIDKSKISTKLQEKWAEYFGNEVLWVPFNTPRGEQLGALILVREKAWAEYEIRIVQRCYTACAHAYKALETTGPSLGHVLKTFFINRKLRLALIGLCLALLFLPIRLSVLTPAQLLPQSPSIIRAPISGIVKQVLVQPNQAVKAGDPLVALDDSELKAKQAIALQNLEVARSELWQAKQAAMTNRKASAQVQILTARHQQKKAELDYINQQLEKVNIKSEATGIVIINSVGEWLGRPVSIGEKILTIADPENKQLEFWVSAADTIALSEAKELLVFFDVMPDVPVEGRVKFINFQPEMSPQNRLAFRGIGELSENDARIGWQGTAKIYGQKTTLGYYLFRRPYAAARQLLGL